MNDLRVFFTAGMLVSLGSSVVGGDYPYVALLITVSVTLIGFTGVLAAQKACSFHATILPSQSGCDLFEIILIKLLSICWIFILVSWCYGVSNALLSGVDSSRAFRNYFGMVVYGIIPILGLLSISLDYLFTIVIWAGLLQALYLLSAIGDSISRFSEINAFASLSQLRVLYSGGTVILFPLLAVSAAFEFYPKRRLKLQSRSRYIDLLNNKLVLMALVVAIVVPSMSKGYALTCLLIIILPWAFSSIEYFRRGRFSTKFFGGCLLVLGGTLLMPHSWWDVISFTFSAEEGSNAIRSEQAQYLIDEFSVFGSGLGSSLRSGYARDDVGYGFELTYLSIIHKLGVFSLPLFLNYVSTVTLAIYRILGGRNLIESYFALGLMGFLVIGAGNPVLLSATAVQLHSFAIYILLFSLNPKGERGRVNIRGPGKR